MRLALSVFSISTIATFTFVRAADAVAYEHRQHGVACFASLNNTQAQQIVTSDSRGVQNHSTSNGQLLVCPVPDHTDMPATAITAANVHGFDASTETAISSQACSSFWNGNGGSCFTSITNSPASTTGDYTISHNAAWANAGAADFKYVVVLLPRLQGSGIRSSLRGIWFASP